MPKENDNLDQVQPDDKAATPEKKAKSAKSLSKPKAIDKVETASVVTPKATLNAAAAPVTANNSDVTPGKRIKLPQNWRSMAIKAAAGLVAVFALVIIIFGVLIYGYHSESPIVYGVAKVIPFPVASVNGHFASYSDYLFQLNANKRGYQQNAKLNNQPAVDFNSTDGKKILTQFHTSSLDKVKSDAVVDQLAAQKKITVTDKDVDALITQLYKNYGGKDTLLKTLKDIYGWDLNDLKSVVRKQLTEQKLSDKVTSDPVIDAQAKTKAADVAKKIKDGGDFATLAKQYSQASDAASGGDLGTFSKGQVSDEIQKAVDALPVGGVSDLVKDQYGYEIIKVTDKTGDTAKASHILIKTIDFTDYMSQQIKNAKYKQYIKA